jgi:hypothetical protein
MGRETVYTRGKVGQGSAVHEKYIQVTGNKIAPWSFTN